MPGSFEEMLEGVRRSIGADTLGYISTEGMIAATEQPASRLCAACFDGTYPIALPTETSIGKNVLEGMLESAGRRSRDARERQRERAQSAVGRYIGIRPENVLRYRKDAITALDCPTDTILTSNRRLE